MPNPSTNVPQQLLQHVHLLSTLRFPHQRDQFQLEEALNHLLDAPRVVQVSNAVAWQYLLCPPDGTVYLAWHPPNQPAFASDGYIWNEPETVHTRDHRGYTIELRVYECGFIPHKEQIAQHRRVRYRLIATQNQNGAQIDPTLEIVHYMQSFDQHRMNARAIPLTPPKQTLMMQRNYLEGQGALPRKEFMLRDQNHWPQINMPSRGPINQYQPAHMNPGAFPTGVRPGPQAPFGQSPAYRQPGMLGPSPNKKPRLPMTHGLSDMTGAAASLNGAHPTLEGPLADEDNPTYGDNLDMLSPREISVTRYKQHHEWMEEILASPYSVSQILPIQLGFGLPDDLAELTKGIFDADSEKENDDPAGYLKISNAQVKDLEKRVTEFGERQSNLMDADKEKHSQKIQALSQEKLFAVLEQRLAKVSSDDTSNETIEDLVKQAEDASGTKITTRDEVVRKSKGGLILPGEEPIPEPINNETQADDFGEFTNLDTAGEALDFYNSGYDNMDYTT